jgi:imidazolonepropionase-like amidohydrolase
MPVIDTNPKRHAIVGATLIDGTGNAPLPQAAVLVKGRRIEAVGTRDTVPLPADAEIFDAKGKYLLPGLIDCHVHVAASGYVPTRPKGSETAYKAVIAINNLRSALQAGVTTVRDVCGDRINLALRTAVERGMLIAPRLFTAGKGICMTGGHGTSEPGFVHEVDTPSAVRSAVRQEQKAGADLIKLLTSHRTDYPEFSKGEIDAGVDEAHRFGLKVAIHAANFVSVRMSAQAGVDTIEHGSFVDEQAADLMAEKDIIIVPTLWVKHDLAKRLEKLKATPEKFPWGDEKDLHISATWFQRCVEQLPKTIELVRSKGIRIAAGTDFVMADHPWALLPEEMEYLTKLGLSNMEAIESATRIGAEVLGKADEFGTVETGKLADLILVDRNPLQDITAMTDVSWVMKEGAIIPRSPEWARRPIKDPIFPQ